MNTELQYTSSIFQLALGVNGVFAFLINHFLSVRHNVVEGFVAKVAEHIPSSDLGQKKRYLRKFIYRSAHGYRLFYSFFIIVIALATVSGAASFYYLHRAAIHPTEAISNSYFTSLSIALLVVNPILYFAFYRSSEWYLRIVNEYIVFSPEEALQYYRGAVSVEVEVKTKYALEKMEWKLMRIRASQTARKVGYFIKHYWHMCRPRRKYSKEEIEALLRDTPADPPHR